MSRTRLLSVVVVATSLALGVLPVAPASADTPGTTWQRQPWTGMLMSSIGYGEPSGQPTFVTVSASTGPSRVWSSPNGVDWTARPTPIDSQGAQDVAYGNGRFVAVFNNANAAWSTDGEAWTASSIGTSMTFSRISYVSGQFMAIGNAVDSNNSVSRPMVATSADGVTWTTTNILDDAYSAWSAPAFGNGRYVSTGLAGSGQRAAYSDDGTTWTRVASTNDSVAWRAVKFFKGRFVAIGSNSSAMTSTDGSTWTSVTLPTAGKNMWALAADADTIVAFGQDVMFTSTDGLDWTAAVPPASGVNWLTVTAGNGGFVGWGRGSDNTSYLVTSGISGSSGSRSGDPAAWLRLDQALPADAAGRCDAIDDEIVAYGTGMRGGWSPSWQHWAGPVCVRVLVNRGSGWMVE